MSLSDILRLRKDIKRYNDAYYSGLEPIVADDKYDNTVAKLRQLEIKEGILPSEGVDKSVGSSLLSVLMVKHKSHMLSLAAANTEEERLSFIKKMIPNMDVQVSFSLEPKYDGLAINLIYERGFLVSAATRGDGLVGEDITENIKLMESIPKRLIGVDRGIIEIRGECVMLKSDFNELNHQRKTKGLSVFSTPRNAAAGTVRLLDKGTFLERKLTFYAYSIGYTNLPSILNLRYQSDVLATLAQWNFRTSVCTVVGQSLSEVIDYFNHMSISREHLPFDADGIVVKVNSLAVQSILGVSGKDPIWACAFKFKNPRVTAQLMDIDWQVGRTGVVTPVALLEPILIDGVTVRRATLHNAQRVSSLSKSGVIRKGDYVLLERAGGVIPAITDHYGNDTQVGEPMSLPEKCPCCHTSLLFVGNDLICPGGYLCQAQLEAKIVYMSSKGCLDIKGVGPTVIARLVNEGFIHDISDLFRLTSDVLLSRSSLTQAQVTKIVKSIEESRFTTFPKFLMCLGITHCGTKHSESLATHFKDIDCIKTASIDELCQVEGIGKHLAQSIYLWFKNPDHLEIIDKLTCPLENGGCGITWDVSSIDHSSKPLEGISYAFTGSLDSMTRSEASSILKALGARILPGVSKGLDVLIVGHDAGHKLAYAHSLGVDIWYEDDLIALIQRHRISDV